MVVSVPPNLPGLINAINPGIFVGGAVYLYDIAWLLGVSLFLFLNPSLRRLAVYSRWRHLLHPVCTVPSEGDHFDRVHFD